MATEEGDMASHRTPPTRLKTAQAFLSHMGHGDVGMAADLLAENVTYRAPGKNALAGLFTGPDEVVQHLTRLAEKTKGTFDAFKWDDWLVSELHVAGLTTVHAQFDHRRYQGHHVIIVSFNAAEKIAGITVFFEDQGAIDRFIGL
jgi:ketosteroid isomerase-like protein